MAKLKSQILPKAKVEALLLILQKRFEKNSLNNELKWTDVAKKLELNPAKLFVLNEMEKTGGEPDVLYYDKKSKEFVFVDCTQESPKERRSLCYDESALKSRKENKPKHSAMGMAAEMGVEILNEEDYRRLQKNIKVDTKTSSWLQTPDAIRKLGGAIFGDRRYDQVFIYHNGAESYYAARGFRAMLRV